MLSPQKVFLAGLEFNFTEKEVFMMFSSLYNSILSVKIVKQGRTKKQNKGFGFMEVGDPEEVKHMLGQVFFYLRGRRFLVKEHKEGDELDKEKEEFYKRRIFIKNVAVSVNNRKLWDFFSSMFELEDAYLIKTAKFGRRRSKKHKSGEKELQYGFVVLKNIQDVDKIIRRKKFMIDGCLAEVEKFDKKKHQILKKDKNKQKEKKLINKKKSPRISREQNSWPRDRPRNNNNNYPEKKFHYQPEKKGQRQDYYYKKKSTRKSNNQATENARSAFNPTTQDYYFQATTTRKNTRNRRNKNFNNNDYQTTTWVKKNPEKQALPRQSSEKNSLAEKNLYQEEQNQKKKFGSQGPQITTFSNQEISPLSQNYLEKNHQQIDQFFNPKIITNTGLPSKRKSLINYFSASEVLSGKVRFAPIQKWTHIESKYSFSSGGEEQEEEPLGDQNRPKVNKKSTEQDAAREDHLSNVPIHDTSPKRSILERIGMAEASQEAADRRTSQVVYNVRHLP